MTRQQAAGIWGPLDTRLPVGSELGDEVSVEEAIAIFHDFDPADRKAALQVLNQYGAELHCFDKIRFAVEQGDEQYVDMLRSSLASQNLRIEKRRERALAELPEYLAAFSAAVQGLSVQGLLNERQTEDILSRIFHPDGIPTIADVPVTMLEYHRLNQLYGGEEPAGDITSYTDFAYGMMVSPGVDEFAEEDRMFNRAHESVHAWLGGVVLLPRIDGGKQVVEPGDIGLWADTVEDGVAVRKGFRANEGMTIFLQEMIAAQNPLFACEEIEGEEAEWRQAVYDCAEREPVLFAAMLDAYIADPTPSDPEAKQEALEKLAEVMGLLRAIPDSLRPLFE